MRSKETQTESLRNFCVEWLNLQLKILEAVAIDGGTIRFWSELLRLDLDTAHIMACWRKRVEGLDDKEFLNVFTKLDVIADAKNAIKSQQKIETVDLRLHDALSDGILRLLLQKKQNRFQTGFFSVDDWLLGLFRNAQGQDLVYAALRKIADKKRSEGVNLDTAARLAEWPYLRLFLHPQIKLQHEVLEQMRSTIDRLRKEVDKCSVKLSDIVVIIKPQQDSGLKDLFSNASFLEKQYTDFQRKRQLLFAYISLVEKGLCAQCPAAKPSSACCLVTHLPRLQNWLEDSILDVPFNSLWVINANPLIAGFPQIFGSSQIFDSCRDLLVEKVKPFLAFAKFLSRAIDKTKARKFNLEEVANMLDLAYNSAVQLHKAVDDESITVGEFRYFFGDLPEQNICSQLDVLHSFGKCVCKLKTNGFLEAHKISLSVSSLRPVAQSLHLALNALEIDSKTVLQHLDGLATGEDISNFLLVDFYEGRKRAVDYKLMKQITNHHVDALKEVTSGRGCDLLKWLRQLGSEGVQRLITEARELMEDPNQLHAVNALTNVASSFGPLIELSSLKNVTEQAVLQAVGSMKVEGKTTLDAIRCASHSLEWLQKTKEWAQADASQHLRDELVKLLDSRAVYVIDCSKETFSDAVQWQSEARNPKVVRKYEFLHTIQSRCALLRANTQHAVEHKSLCDRFEKSLEMANLRAKNEMGLYAAGYLPFLFESQTIECFGVEMHEGDGNRIHREKKELLNRWTKTVEKFREKLPVLRMLTMQDIRGLVRSTTSRRSWQFLLWAFPDLNFDSVVDATIKHEQSLQDVICKGQWVCDTCSSPNANCVCCQTCTLFRSPEPLFLKLQCLYDNLEQISPRQRPEERSSTNALGSKLKFRIIRAPLRKMTFAIAMEAILSEKSDVSLDANVRLTAKEIVLASASTHEEELLLLFARARSGDFACRCH